MLGYYYFKNISLNRYFRRIITSSVLFSSKFLPDNFTWNIRFLRVMKNSTQHVKMVGLILKMVELLSFLYIIALVVYGLKRYLVNYAYHAATWINTIWLAAAIKARHEEPYSMQRLLVNVVDQKPSPRCVLQIAVMKNFAKFTGKCMCRCLFLTTLQSFKLNHLF